MDCFLDFSKNIKKKFQKKKNFSVERICFMIRIPLVFILLVQSVNLQNSFRGNFIITLKQRIQALLRLEIGKLQ